MTKCLFTYGFRPSFTSLRELGRLEGETDIKKRELGLVDCVMVDYLGSLP